MGTLAGTAVGTVAGTAVGTVAGTAGERTTVSAAAGAVGYTVLILAPGNNRLSNYAPAHSWSAVTMGFISQLQFQLFARTSVSVLSTFTAIMAHT